MLNAVAELMDGEEVINFSNVLQKESLVNQGCVTSSDWRATWRIKLARRLKTAVSSANASGRAQALLPNSVAHSTSTIRSFSLDTSNIDGHTIAELVNEVSAQLQSVQSMSSEELWSELASLLDLLKLTFRPLRAAIGSWKRQQQLCAKQGEDEDVLRKSGDHANDCCTADLFSHLQTIAENAQLVSNQLYCLLDLAHNCSMTTGRSRFEKLRENVAVSIAELTRMCFIVTRQPDQVLKKDVKFAVSVSLLAGWRTEVPHRAVRVSAAVYAENEIAKSEHTGNWAPSYSKIAINSPDVFLASTFSNDADAELRVQWQKGLPTKRRASDKKNANSNSNANSILAKQVTPAYHADFAGVSWNKTEQERRSAANSPCVTDLKYALVFETEWLIVTKEHSYVQKVRLRCMSLPITCVVHVSQGSRARGTIFWDNAFAAYQVGLQCDCCRVSAKFTQVPHCTSSNDAETSKQQLDYRPLFGDGNDGGGVHYCRQPFETPEVVGWSVFKRELRRWFESQTKGKLNEEHLEFVKQCVVLHQPVANTTSGSGSSLNLLSASPRHGFRNEPRVTRSRVLAEAISYPIKFSSFWSWLCGVKKMVTDGGDALVAYLWRKGLIHFMTREEAVQKLNQLAPDVLADTMLIHFYSSERLKTHNGTLNLGRGAIVVTQGYYCKDAASGGTNVKVRSIEPWNSEMLKQMDLQRRLTSEKLERSIIYPLGQDSWRVCLQQFHQQLSNDTNYSLSQHAVTADAQSSDSEYVLTEYECVPKDPNEDPRPRSLKRNHTSACTAAETDVLKSESI